MNVYPTVQPLPEEPTNEEIANAPPVPIGMRKREGVEVGCGSVNCGACYEADSRCAYCGRPSEGNFSIHRDGMDEGPEVDLCDGCGGHATPTAGQIWARISTTHPEDYDPEPETPRRGRVVSEPPRKPRVAAPSRREVELT